LLTSYYYYGIVLHRTIEQIRSSSSLLLFLVIEATLE